MSLQRIRNAGDDLQRWQAGYTALGWLWSWAPAPLQVWVQSLLAGVVVTVGSLVVTFFRHSLANAYLLSIAAGAIAFIAVAMVRKLGGESSPSQLQAVTDQPPREDLRLADAVQAEMQSVLELFYDDNDPICHQRGGRVERIVGGGNVSCDETIYRVGIRSQRPLERCRIMLAKSEPIPHDPGAQRLGLPMRPRFPVVSGSAEFSVNPNAPAYVDVLQEIVAEINPMNRAASIRLIYVNEDRGKANWFEHGDYILTFRLEGPTLTPVNFRLAVEYDGRRQYRCWRVRQAE